MIGPPVLVQGNRVGTAPGTITFGQSADEQLAQLRAQTEAFMQAQQRTSRASLVLQAVATIAVTTIAIAGVVGALTARQEVSTLGDDRRRPRRRR